MGRDWLKYQARVVMKIYFTRKISKRRIHTYSNNLNPQVETCTFKMPDRLVSVYIVRVLLCFLFNSFFLNVHVEMKNAINPPKEKKD